MGGASGTYGEKGNGEANGTYGDKGNGGASDTYGVKGNGGTNGTYWDKGNGGASGTYGEKVNVYGVFTEKAEVMKPYGRATHIWHDNIKKTSMKEHSKAWTGFICLRAGRSRGIL